MIYADYNFYVGDYVGNVIPDAEAFASAVRDASAYIDYVTHNRIVFDDLPETVKDKVRMAACAAAEVSYKQETMGEDSPTVSSESVGNHSKTFSVNKRTFEQREREKRLKVTQYLHGTGLLYGGLK